MKWSIVNHPGYTQASRVGVELEPEDEPLKFFLSAIRLERMPELVRDAAAREGYPGDPAGVIFHGDLDGEDIAAGEGFEPGHVRVYHHVFGDSLLAEELFLRILHEYARTLLAAYRDDDEVGPEWATGMAAAIEELGCTLPDEPT